MKFPSTAIPTLALLVLALGCADARPPAYTKKLKGAAETGDATGTKTPTIGEEPGTDTENPDSTKASYVYDMEGKRSENTYVEDKEKESQVSCKPQGPNEAKFHETCESMGYSLAKNGLCSIACTGDVTTPVLSAESSLPKMMVGKTVYDEQWKPFAYEYVESQMMCSPSSEEEGKAHAKFVDDCVKGGFHLLISGPCSVACTGLPAMEPEPVEDPWKGTVKDPGTDGDGDFTIGPNYTDAADTKVKSGVAKGTIKEFSMNSKDSKIYKGQDDFLTFKGDFTRKGWLYTPAGYKGDKELPFMLVGDGNWSQHRDLMSKVLDNLIAAKKIPPMAAVFINPGVINNKGDGPGSQRSFEYDSVTGAYGDFIETEVLPKLTKDFGVKFTENPEGRGTMGGSSSGAMAFTMAWFKPDKYRRVLTYSGTFVKRIVTAEHPKGALEYPEKLIPMSDKKPLRVFIHVSENDNYINADNDWKKANNEMAKALKDKGYHYRFQYAKNAGHIDGKVYRQTLPENLIWLWRGYPIP